MPIDTDKLISEKRRDLIAAVRAAREGRTLREVADEIGTAPSTLSAPRLKAGQLRTIEKLAGWEQAPSVRACAQELLELMGIPRDIVASIGSAPRGGNVIDLVSYRTPRKSPAKSALRPVFIHAALQMEATDFPPRTLAELLFDDPAADFDTLSKRAINDLVMLFADARYFAAFAQALRCDNKPPRHSFDTFRLHPFLYLEKVDAYNATVTGTGVEQIYAAEQYVFTGRGVFDIFRGTPGSDSWDAMIERMTAHVAPQNFLPYDFEQKNAAVERIAREAQTENGQLYEALAYMTDLLPGDWHVPEKPLVLAAASCAAIRADMTALCAATAFRHAWRDDPVLSRTALFRVASLIHSLCHQTYLTASEHWGRAVRDLPEEDERQFMSDRKTMWGQYASTVEALSSDDGAWFLFRTPAREALAYVSRNGSLLQEEAFSAMKPGSIFHKYISVDGSLLPKNGFTIGRDHLYSF